MIGDVDPWANRVAIDAEGDLPTSPLSFDPAQTAFIGGRDDMAVTGRCSVYFAGTDVTGPLHLGHLYCFAAGRCAAEQGRGQFVVSINEIESGLSRDVPADRALRNAELIRIDLQRHGISVHSRLRDAELIYASCRLFRWLLNDRHGLVSEVYGHIRQPDLLAICPMILTPAFLGRDANSSVCAVYGYDEVKHVEFIYRLYKDAEFRHWATQNCVAHLPAFTYILSPLIAASDPHFKMSKSRLHDAIPWDSAPDGEVGHKGMFWRLYDFANQRAPRTAASPLGEAVARHAGRKHAFL